MTVLGEWKRKAFGSLRSPRRCRVLRCAQNDDVKLTTATANGQLFVKMVLVGWLQEQGDGGSVGQSGSCGGGGCSGDRDDVGFGGCGGLAAGVDTVSAAGTEGEGGRQKSKGQKPCCFAGSQPEGEAGDWGEKKGQCG